MLLLGPGVIEDRGGIVVEVGLLLLLLLLLLLKVAELEFASCGCRDGVSE